MTPYETPERGIAWRCGTAPGAHQRNPACAHRHERHVAAVYIGADGTRTQYLPVLVPARSARSVVRDGALTPDQRRTSGESMP